MRQLFLLRHAKSSWDEAGLDDFDRPLNNRGRRAARAMAAYLRQQDLRPALVLCSAARRTRETYDILEPSLEGIPVSFEAELYEAAKHDLLERLRRLDDHLDSVLLIGHNPGLERLAGALAGGHGEAKALARLADKYPTGTLAVLETGTAHWGALEDAGCRLTRFIRPADLD
ncbi:MAG: SixA phosphatase family protein [Bacteroidales bacterium]